MVDWLAGNRVRGTSTERTTSAGFNGGFTGTGGWKEVGRTTLGSAGDTITVSSLPDKRYYMILTDTRRSSGSPLPSTRFNSDSGSNYSLRKSENGASDGTAVSQTNIQQYGSGSDIYDNGFKVGYISNLASKEKLVTDHYVHNVTSGGNSSPSRAETVGKWTNTSNAINSITQFDTGSDNFTSGSETVILGWDEDDTHTTNFWEELASVNASGSSTNLSSGTISAKKYLWVQCYTEGNSGDILQTFNNDSGSNYCRRGSADGGSDFTSVNAVSVGNMHNGGHGEPSFSSMFVINNSANEKLATGHSIQQNTAGAGTAPRRMEFIGKWSNTSAQITEIDFDSQNGNFGTNSIIKVWGSN